ncbi:MAG: CoA transferase [Planctomycetes bacterium]|nr:CoA transferase [Planctomycetota bacterium]
MADPCAPPLVGVRVIDLTRLLPGPCAAMWLGDLGADVLKVEDTGAGDYLRWQQAPIAEGMSGAFALLNRNKRALSLDLKQPEGVELFLRLAASADVILEGFRPGVADRLGVGYEAVRRRRPEIVYAAITGYGQTGPYRDFPGHDVNYLGYAGAAALTGEAAGKPAVPGVQIADLAGGALFCCFAVVSALLARARTGRGQYLDVSMMDGVSALLPFSFGALFGGAARSARDGGVGGAGSAVPSRGRDTLDGGRACYDIYETRDGKYLTVGALEPKFWERLCDLVGLPDLRAAYFAGKVSDQQARARLRETLLTRDRDDWLALLKEAGACVGPVLELDEAVNDPHANARGMFPSLRLAGDVTIPQIAFPVKFSETPPTIRRPPPRPGEHTDEVLREILGLAPEQIAALRASGVVR